MISLGLERDRSGAGGEGAPNEFERQDCISEKRDDLIAGVERKLAVSSTGSERFVIR